MGGRFGELLLILLIILLLFGAGKLPKVMADIGKSLRALKKGLSSDDEKDGDENAS
jgi:sec-independent protein translocase protein TatA